MCRARHADFAAMLALAGITALGEPSLWRGETTVGIDSLTQYYPWYTFLGDGLRAGRIPGWNPHQFSGAPFAADPLSGWTYLPAMLMFAALPTATAAPAYLLLHLLLAALSAYALGRVLGLGIVGALLAGLAYSQNGFFSVHNVCCFAFASVAAWLPLALLGTELAIRSTRPTGQACWWGLVGLALSQILAAWLGQGAYYALLVFGGYAAYRTLLRPPNPATSWRARVIGLALHGGGPVLFGFGLAAAGLLPRLEYNALSNLAGGYPGGEGAGGWRVPDWWQLWAPSTWYAGVSVLLLALVAPWAARGWPVGPFLLALSAGLLVLTGQEPTLLHLALELLPRFSQLHPHLPERILTVFYLGIAMLAGATLTGLQRRADARLLPLLLLLVLADLRTSRDVVLAEYAASTQIHQLLRVDLAAEYKATGAGHFLQSLDAGEPFRFFGFAPEPNGPAYTERFADPHATALVVNNRALSLGLDDVQGYNAVHLASYDEYLAALNGRTQNYHNAEVFEPGVGSPLVDLLNARYIVAPSNRAAALVARYGYPTVYADDDVRVLENPRAFPRAWIVHAAQQVERGQALDLLATGRADPRQTALLEAPPPLLGQPDDPSADTALILSYEADRIALRTSTGAAGLLVLSEVYYPAWKAYVDGIPAPLYVANHAFRAAPVPAGDHTVELRYESTALRLGLAISFGTYLVWLGLLIAVSRRVADRPGTANRERSKLGAMSR